MLPMTMKKAYIATRQMAASQNASRTVRVDSDSRSGCGRWRCIRTFLRVQGWWALRADRSLRGRVRSRARPRNSGWSETAPLARVHEARITLDGVPALEPRVHDPEGRKCEDPDGQSRHLLRLQRPQDEEEAEHEQHTEREDPEQIARDVEVACQTLNQRNTPYRRDDDEIVEERQRADKWSAQPSARGCVGGACAADSSRSRCSPPSPWRPPRAPTPRRSSSRPRSRQSRFPARASSVATASRAARSSSAA